MFVLVKPRLRQSGNNGSSIEQRLYTNIIVELDIYLWAPYYSLGNFFIIITQ